MPKPVMVNAVTRPSRDARVDGAPVDDDDRPVEAAAAGRQREMSGKAGQQPDGTASFDASHLSLVETEFGEVADIVDDLGFRPGRHVESWELTGEPRPRLNNSLRGLASLPVRVTPTTFS